MRDSNPRPLAPEGAGFSCGVCDWSNTQDYAYGVLHSCHVRCGNSSYKVNESGFGDASYLKSIGC